MKFAHLSDCHLGGWREQELKELNFQSFKYALDECKKEKVDFILIAGDLFDSAYPPIDILKETFREFRKVKEAGIPVFLIAGSHDYSAAGKTFLDVLEKAGFCKNVSIFEERDGKIILQPTIYNHYAIYGYHGKKTNLEIEEINRIKLQDSPGLFKILMLHTQIRDAIGTLPIDSVNQENLPNSDYLALGHLHINYQKGNRIYGGPTFPNNISELEELKGGHFYIFDNGMIKRREIKLKEVFTLNLEVKNALNATEEILNALKKENLKDKLVIIKIQGILKVGKSSDIDFVKIENYLKDTGAYVMLKSTSRLQTMENDIKSEIINSIQFEADIIKKFGESNPSKFNSLIPVLIKTLQLDKTEDEKLYIFEDRLISETKKILSI